MKSMKWSKILVGAAIVIVLLLLLFDIGATAEFQISGYGSGEFALTGDQKRQANEMVESWGTKKPASIVVQGLADKSGKKAENDAVGRNRAYEMKEFLKSKGYPENIISALSLSDSADARKVVVTVEFTVASTSASNAQPAAPTATSYFTEAVRLFLTSVAVAFAVLVPIVIWFLLKRRRRKSEVAKTEVEVAEKTEQSSETVLETRWVEADHDGATFLVRVVKRGDEKWYTPFMTLENSSKPLCRAEFQMAKKAVRGCVKDARYADQFARLLIAKEDVKEK